MLRAQDAPTDSGALDRHLSRTADVGHRTCRRKKTLGYCKRPRSPRLFGHVACPMPLGNSRFLETAWKAPAANAASAASSRDRRETALEGPSPAQLAEARGAAPAVTHDPEERCPRRWAVRRAGWFQAENRSGISGRHCAGARHYVQVENTW